MTFWRFKKDRVRDLDSLPPSGFKGPLKSQKGIALLVALFSINMLLFLAMEVSYDTSVEYVIASQKINRLKAYYAAKAGVEISLLRILIYKKALALVGGSLGEQVSMLDPIWQFPFSWPPMLPDDVSGADKEIIKGIVAESQMEAQFLATISAESSKLDLNDLGSSSASLQKATKQHILQILTKKAEDDEVFREENDSSEFEALVNNILDWVDEDQVSLNGGDEGSLYRDDMQSDFIPPNQPFKTMEELHMVDGMTDSIYNFLSSQLTIFGSKGVNVNYSGEDILRAFDIQITDEVVAAIIKRRSNDDEGGLFKNEEDFLGFLENQGVDTETFNEAQIPFIFDPEYNFRIISTGVYGKSSREITAVSYDSENIKDRLVSILEKDEEDKEGPEEEPPSDGSGEPKAGDKSLDPDREGGDQKTSSKKKNIKIPKGRPRVVYWSEI